MMTDELPQDEPLSPHSDQVAETPSSERQEVPDDSGQQELGDQDLAESKAYGQRELYVSLVDMTLDLVYLGCMAFWLGQPISEWLLTWPWMQNAWFQLVGMFGVVMGLHYAISFPISFYSGFLLEHQFKLSKQSFPRWLRRYLLQNLLAMALGLVLVLGLFAIIWWTGSYWWWVATAATFLVTVLLGQLVPVLIVPLFYKVEKLEDDRLAQRFRLLAKGTSLKIEGVYRMKLSSETSKGNAMLAGLGRTRRVLLGDTLLDDFSEDEIAVVLAHEVGHHVYHHIPKLIALGLLFSAAGFFFADRVLVGWFSLSQTTADYAQIPVSALPIILFCVTLANLVLSPLRNWISRRFETACDAYALEVTDDRTAYRAAFSRLAKMNKADPDPHPLEVAFFHDHPPISQRLAAAD
jgi:STE24 endopeptidase